VDDEVVADDPARLRARLLEDLRELGQYAGLEPQPVFGRTLGGAQLVVLPRPPGQLDVRIQSTGLPSATNRASRDTLDRNAVQSTMYSRPGYSESPLNSTFVARS
jgi:hypothetical protein